MPVEVDRLEQPDGTACVGRLSSATTRSGRSVKSRFFQAPAMHAVGERLAGDLLDPGVDGRLRLGGLVVDVVVRLRPGPRAACLTTSGWSSRNSVRTIRWVVTNLPLGHRRRLVDQHLAAALLHEAGRPRLGHPGAVDVAGLERLERLGVLLRHDRRRRRRRSVSVLRPLLLQPVRERDVLGVAELRAWRSSCP